MKICQLKGSTFSLDSETTGLRQFNGDKAFLWSASDDESDYYWDLRKDDSVSFYNELKGALEDPDTHIILFNAKFDLKFIYAQLGIFEIKAKISDVQILYRLYKNNLYDSNPKLETVAKEFGLNKDDGPLKWITENRAFKAVVKANGKQERIPQFNLVPDSILIPYAKIDARITYQLYFILMNELRKLDEYNIPLGKSILDVVKLEEETLKVLLKIETRGAHVQTSYIKESLEREKTSSKKLREEIEQAIGGSFTDSNKTLSELFKNDAEFTDKCERTKTGAISFTNEILSNASNRTARAIAALRHHDKRIGTYLANYIEATDQDGRIRCSFNQAASRTGRLSSSNPNLQNVPSVDEDSTEEEYIESKIIRDCFGVPDDYYFVSIDWQAQEYRVLLDISEEKSVINEIKRGLDIHSVTASMMGVIRKVAKNIGFGLLYGMGIEELSRTLGVPFNEAKRLKNLYFAKLPKIAYVVTGILKKAELGKLSNFMGRIYRFDKGFSYKAVNYIIQGTCADILRISLINIDKLLTEKNSKSFIILTIHDEICFQMHKDELNLIPEIQNIMRESYPSKHLPLETSVEIGKLWGSLEEYGAWQEKTKQDLVTA